jgi:RNA polymerase primary sigma factor
MTTHEQVSYGDALSAAEARERARSVRLLRAAQRGDAGAQARLVSAHTGLVRAIAAHYGGSGLPVEDLVQEGAIGLLEAVGRFDFSRDVPFEAFAAFHIRRAIRNALTERARLIRLPKGIVQRRRALALVDAEFVAAHGRPAAAAELAELTGLALDDVSAARDAPAATLSLDGAASPDATPLVEVVPGDAVDPEDVLVRCDEARTIRAAVHALSPRERLVVTRRFGLDGPALSTATIAGDLGVSPQRANRVATDALYHLRDALAG